MNKSALFSTLLLAMVLTISVDVAYAQSNKTIDRAVDSHNGHEYVDLGLPSGIMWATCNIGSIAPNDYGDYFAWGEISTSADDSRWYQVSNSTLKSQGVIDSRGVLRLNYDAARQKWGGSWRMPTQTETKELILFCTWEWTTVGGVTGHRATGPNGNSIFFPAAGYFDSRTRLDGTNGFYWCSTVDDDSGYSFCLSFISNSNGMCYNSHRFFRYPIRPVKY